MRLSEWLQTPVSQGIRNDSLFQAVLQAREAGWTADEIMYTCRAKAVRDGLTQREAEGTIRSAMGHPLTPRPRYERVSGNGTARIDPDGLIGGNVVAAAIQDTSTIPHAAVDWERSDLPRFLRALFQPEEVAAYVAKAFRHEETGQWRPSGRGIFGQTVQSWLDQLERQTPTVDLGLKPGQEHGAWIRLNPMDGQGIGDANVVEYRHVLVESDSMPIEEQWAVLNRLRVPCATIVHSGGKSLHAAVKVGAGRDRDEYERRSTKLYSILEEHGLKVDRQNRNPSRLSRLPGVWRGEHQQYLLAVDVGCSNWEEWLEFIEHMAGVPEPESAGEALRHKPPLDAELIHGILRRGHKLLLAGPSKAGKSYALIQLAAAVSSGVSWLGFQCEQGKVFYVNLEIARPSMIQRLEDVGDHVKAEWDNVTLWSLRGYQAEIDVLKARIMKHLVGADYSLVIIDPIYKVLAGDENSASDMARFCNQLEEIAYHSKAAVAFCSHFSKGQQGHKASIDRASGSGVFGRDPDAIGTLTEAEGDDPYLYLLEWTLREFRSPQPTTLRFDWPVHLVEEVQAEPKGKAGRPAKVEQDEYVQAWSDLSVKSNLDFVPMEAMAEHLGVSLRTAQRRVRSCSMLVSEEGRVYLGCGGTKYEKH
jgi:RecA-family ATPase